MPEIGGVFRQPFNEQVAFFRQKLGNQIPTEKWTDVQKSAHDKGFMVAGAMSADLLSDLAAAVDNAIAGGGSLDAFRKDFRAIKARHGWDHTGDFNWRTKVIYQTNMSTSYNAGRLAQLVEGAFAYWVYIHSKTVAHPRREHQVWDGITLPPEHPWWKTHFTPNGWGCQCRIKGTNRLKPGARTSAPDEGIDPATGAPKGIDKGWDYMPGNTVKDTVQTMAGKTVQWEYTLAKAYMESVPDGIKDQFAQSYRNLPSTADEARRFAKRMIEGRPNHRPYQTMGLLTTDEAAQVAALKGVNVKHFDHALDEFSIKHIHNEHGNPVTEARRGQRAVTAEDFERLPELLNAPDEILDGGVSDTTGQPLVMYKKAFGNETWVYVAEIRKKRRTLASTTMYIQT